MSTEDLNSIDGADILGLPDDEVESMGLYDTGLSPESTEEAPEELEQEDTDDSTDDADAGEEDQTEPDEEDQEDLDDDDEESDEDGSDSTEQDGSELDYKEEYKKILAPFKANGREMQVDTVDDAVTLMKQGANYNKKMAALKPHLKLVRTLENSKLTDEADINFLIDLHNKKPEAINKLIKESGIDPLDIDTDNADDYKPETHTVTDQEMELEAVLDEIKDTQTYADTIHLVSEQWDAASRDVIVKNPKIIKALNDQKQNGIFDQIVSVVEKERMLGRLDGVSDFEAYHQTGDRLYAEGKFGQPSNQTNAEETTTTVTTDRKPKDTKLKNRKKAASATKSRRVQKQNSEFNPLALSDDEFEKAMASKYR